MATINALPSFAVKLVSGLVSGLSGLSAGVWTDKGGKIFKIVTNSVPAATRKAACRGWRRIAGWVNGWQANAAKCV